VAAVCGVERWTVKTLQDKAKLLRRQNTTVAHLISVAKPAHLPATSLPFERRVFRVTAAVTLVRQEADQDLHIVIQKGPLSIRVWDASLLTATSNSVTLDCGSADISLSAVRDTNFPYVWTITAANAGPSAATVTITAHCSETLSTGAGAGWTVVSTIGHDLVYVSTNPIASGGSLSALIGCELRPAIRRMATPRSRHLHFPTRTRHPTTASRPRTTTWRSQPRRSEEQSGGGAASMRRPTSTQGLLDVRFGLHATSPEEEKRRPRRATHAPFEPAREGGGRRVERPNRAPLQFAERQANPSTGCSSIPFSATPVCPWRKSKKPAS